MPRELDLQLVVTREILETSDLNQVIHAILSGITRPGGLGFDRAFLFLADDNGRELRPRAVTGVSADGQADPDAADRLAGFVVPLAASIPDISAGDENIPMQALVARCAGLREPFLSNTGWAFYQPPTASGGEVLRLTRLAAVPLTVKSSVLGVLLVDNTHRGQSIEKEQIRILQTLGNLAALAIEKERMRRRLEECAIRDGLTGVYTRRHFEARLDREVDAARKSGRALALLVFHITNFAECNQTHGRSRGDEVLKNMADLLRKRVRTEDLIARHGEEEFVVMLTGSATREEAVKVAEKLIIQINEQVLGGLPAGDIKVCGGMAWMPARRLDGAKLAERLVYALQQAMQSGAGGIFLAVDEA